MYNNLDREQVKQLCVNILVSAARDWRALCKLEVENMFSPFKKRPEDIHYNGETYTSIRKFFESDYGENICEATGRNAGRMLKFLEQYRVKVLRKEKERVENRK